MGRFNLLDEPWISVVVDDKGTSKEVSLKALFENAHLFKDFGGDSKTQDFALMRVLLAVLHTVFSRFNANGEKYEYFSLDSRFKQIEEIDEEDLVDYKDDLYDTWIELWKRGNFPGIVCDYLEKWRERFYLFDEEYPFFQVRAEDISIEKISRNKPTPIAGKNINRLISESGNKVALFSPKFEKDDNKDRLRNAEIARWLITFQAYTGLGDKVIFGKEKYKASKGWLFDLGGIFLKGSSIFETLMLNFFIACEESNNLLNIQQPCWELEPDDLVEKYFIEDISNIASLYTAWSRAIYIDPMFDESQPFCCYIVKLPEIRHTDNFLEPMTLWRYNESGNNKGLYTPRKHAVNKSVWRSFGLIAITERGEFKRKPGIIDWLNDINSKLTDYTDLPELNPDISAVGMQDDGNATSWVPTDEIFDTLSIESFILTDLSEAGWVSRINETVEKTKKVVSVLYKKFLTDIKEIRNLQSDLFVDQKIEELYFIIDTPFRKWIAGIRYNDCKDSKIKEWWKELYKLVTREAYEFYLNGCMRDYMGMEKNGKIINIATAYNYLIRSLNNEIYFKEEKDGDRE